VTWEDLARVVAPKVLTDAIDTSERLRALGIPHALVGGLAVGLHGHPRATKDVDFIVGTAAFASTKPILSFREELGGIVRWGVISPPFRTIRRWSRRCNCPRQGRYRSSRSRCWS